MNGITAEVEAKAGIGRTTAKNRIRDMKALMGIESTKYSDATKGQIITAILDDSPIVSVTGASTLDEIHAAGNYHGAKTGEHYRLFCQCVAALRDHCGSKVGGSEFSSLALAYWNLSSGKASECLSVGRADYFSEFGGVMPSSKSAMNELARLPKSLFIEFAEAGDISASMTANDVSELGNQRGKKMLGEEVDALISEKLVSETVSKEMESLSSQVGIKGISYGALHERIEQIHTEADEVTPDDLMKEQRAKREAKERSAERKKQENKLFLKFLESGGNPYAGVFENVEANLRTTENVYQGLIGLIIEAKSAEMNKKLFRVLASEFHTDTGGNEESIKRLGQLKAKAKELGMLNREAS